MIIREFIPASSGDGEKDTKDTSRSPHLPPSSKEDERRLLLEELAVHVNNSDSSLVKVDKDSHATEYKTNRRFNSRS